MAIRMGRRVSMLHQKLITKKQNNNPRRPDIFRGEHGQQQELRVAQNPDE